MRSLQSHMGKPTRLFQPHENLMGPLKAQGFCLLHRITRPLRGVCSSMLFSPTEHTCGDLCQRCTVLFGIESAEIGKPLGWMLLASMYDMPKLDLLLVFEHFSRPLHLITNRSSQVKDHDRFGRFETFVDPLLGVHQKPQTALSNHDDVERLIADRRIWQIGQPVRLIATGHSRHETGFVWSQDPAWESWVLNACI